MNKVLFVLCVVIFLLVLSLITTSFLWADEIFVPDRLVWSRLNPRTIVIYENDNAIAVVEVYYAHIYRNSDILFFDTIIKYGSKVMIDRKVYDVKEVKKIDAKEIQKLYKEQK